MIGGKDSKKDVGGFSMYTGLGAIQLLAANPTTEEYKAITGKDPYLDLDYTKRDGYNDDTVRPLNFLYKRVVDSTYGLLAISLSNKVVASKTGKNKFVDSVGRVSYYLDSVNKISPKFKFDAENCRKVFYGEEQYLQIVKCLFRYSPTSPEANLLADLQENEADIKSIYSGNYKGINKLIKSLDPQDFGISVLFTVKSKEENFYQRVATNPETIGIAFPMPTESTLVVPSRHIELVRKIHHKQVEEGYSISKDLFTIELQKFVLEECINYSDVEAVDDFDDTSLEDHPFGDSVDTDSLENPEDYF